MLHIEKTRNYLMVETSTYQITLYTQSFSISVHIMSLIS